MTRKLLRHHSFPAKSNRASDSFVAWLIVEVAGLFRGPTGWCLESGVSCSAWHSDNPGSARVPIPIHRACGLVAVRAASTLCHCTSCWRAFPRGAARGGREWKGRGVVTWSKRYTKNPSSSVAQILFAVCTSSDRVSGLSCKVPHVLGIDLFYLLFSLDI